MGQAAEDLLLKLASASIQELAAIRREIGSLSSQVNRLDSIVSGLAPSGHSVAINGEESHKKAPSTPVAVEGLAADLLVAHQPLREAFASHCVAGRLWVELQALSGSSSLAQVAPAELSQALVESWQHGVLTVAVFRPSLKDVSKAELVSDSNEIQALLASEASAAAASPGAIVMVLPLFQKLSHELLEVLVAWLARERLEITVDLLAAIARGLVKRDVVVSDIDLLSNLPIRQPGFALSCTAGSTVHITPSHGSPTALPRYSAGQEGVLRIQAQSGAQDAALMCGVLDALSRGATQFLPASMQKGGILLVAELLRLQKAMIVLRVQPPLFAACGGALAWALAAQEYLYPASLSKPQASLDVPLPVPTANVLQTTQSSAAAVREADVEAVPGPVRFAEVPQPMLEQAGCQVQLPAATATPPPVVAEEGTDEALLPDAGDGEDSMAEMDDFGQDGDGMEEDGAADGAKSIPTLEAQAAFIQCFREELTSDRALLLSQLNNLYKMRSGEELPYKECGYERLRDFLLEIPGLALLGRGNRLQVKVSDAATFQEFSDRAMAMDTPAGVHGPRFQMPAPPPPAMQQKIKELFLAAPDNEVPLRKFVNMWHAQFPTEQLAYRSLGYRDLRGLLSAMPFLEKVGGKSDAKYILRPGQGGLPEVPTPSPGWPASAAAAQAKVPGQICGASPQMLMPGQVRQGQSAVPGALPAQVQPQQQQQLLQQQLQQQQQQQLQQLQQQQHQPQQLQLQQFQQQQQLQQLQQQQHQPQQMQLQQQQQCQPLQQPLQQPQVQPQPQQPQVQPQQPQQQQQQQAQQQMQPQLQQQIQQLAAGAGGFCGGQPQAAAVAAAAAAVAACGANAPPSLGQAALVNDIGGGSSASAWRRPPGGGLAAASHLDGAAACMPPPQLEPPWQSRPGQPSQVATADPNSLWLDQRGPFTLGDRCASSGSNLSVQNNMVGLMPTPAASPLSPSASTGLPDPAWFGSGRFQSQPGVRKVQVNDIPDVADCPRSMPEGAAGTVGSSHQVRNVLNDPDDLPVFDFSDPPPQSYFALADGLVVSRRQDRIRKKAAPTYFVSSPGAVSSETRDASIHQGKFDLPSILQTQLLRDVPCLVCDISAGQVMVANSKCDALFQTYNSASQLTETDIFSLVHPDDRDEFSTHVAYLTLSERTRMDDHQLRIVTLMGATRRVNMAGAQLIGMWWQFSFTSLDQTDAPGHS